MKAIVFDMDGIMVDSEPLYRKVQHEIAAKFNKTMPEEIRRQMMGRKPQESLQIFVRELGIPMSVEEILEMRNNIMRQKYRSEMDPMPGLFHIIDTFYGKLKLAVATGAQQEFLDIVLDRFNIREKFSVLQSSDDIQTGKPDPEIYLKACGKLGFPPEECFVLEDSVNGVLAGKNAGCYVIAVPEESNTDQRFSSANVIVKDLFAASRHIGEMLT